MQNNVGNQYPTWKKTAIFVLKFFSILLGNWPNKRFGCIVLHMYSTGPQVQLETEDN